MLLIKTSFDYADEFNVVGYDIITEKQFEEDKELVHEVLSRRGEVECYFGTNEYIPITSPEDFYSQLNVKTISEEDAEVIKQHLGTSYGTFSYNDVIDRIRDHENYYDDEDEDEYDDSWEDEIGYEDEESSSSV